MLVGYMRISTAHERQSVGLQRDALLTARVDERHLHEDRAPELVTTAPVSRPASPICAVATSWSFGSWTVWAARSRTSSRSSSS